MDPNAYVDYIETFLVSFVCRAYGNFFRLRKIVISIQASQKDVDDFFFFLLSLLSDEAAGYVGYRGLGGEWSVVAASRHSVPGSLPRYTQQVREGPPPVKANSYQALRIYSLTGIQCTYI